MERWAGRVALVTGASAGIGAGIATALVKSGMIVVGCARRLEKMQNLAASMSASKGQLHPIKCDLSQEADIMALFAEIKAKFGGVDVCINNAGVAPSFGELLSGVTNNWRRMLDINILALSICTREAFNSMNERNVDDGQIININSISGHQVFNSPDMFFYSATKFAVRALTEGVRKELRLTKSHIRVAEICPGSVQTEFYGLMLGEDNAKAYYSSFKALKPEDIAESVLYILSAPPHVQVHDILVAPTAKS